MKIISKISSLILLLLFILQSSLQAQNKNSLHIISKKEIGQIEVGNPYVGIEIHKSFPMLNRISFYYPVANSIDISEDYWKRANYRIMAVGIKIGNSPKKLLDNEVYQVDQTPYSVSFLKVKDESKIEISYQFCKDEPAMVVTYKFTNQSNVAKDYEVYTRFAAVLRTSHTYQTFDSANSAYNSQNNTLSINYDDIETARAKVFFSNTGATPESYTSAYPADYSSVDQWWLDHNSPLPGKTLPVGKEDKVCAAFVYKRKLKSGESLVIKQVIGSIKISDGEKKIDEILSNYQSEIKKYENYVLDKSVLKNQFITGDNDLDFTSEWAKAILAVDRHYINGSIEPMPCPAEYNFFFTHDVLLTDLAAVNFNLNRVKSDLKFIISHADKDKVIPHAYYWKDTKFVTELAGSENWNHFWFIIVCARYLRHSNDVKLLSELYPYISKSVETALKNEGKDTLMWSMRPDWWDIGNNSGPRAYMTILAIRALKEFTFINSVLNKSLSEIKKYDQLSNKLNQSMVDKLWDSNLKYLISYYQDGSEDQHIYMGSLLALHFNQLDKTKDMELLNTAKKFLLDEKLGIYDIYPMDFNKLIDYLHFAGNEAGEPYYYANGGIWPHGNSWYALALIKNGYNDSAFTFIKRTMTINGINNSPNGQPAMYEYRISDKNSPEVYGKIDKPQFLWAGGWYLYTIYNLFGLRENDWNISFSPYVPKGMNTVSFPLTFNNKNCSVRITGKNKEIQSVSFDGKVLPTAIIPCDLNNLSKIHIKMGSTKTPYLMSANGKLFSPEFDEKKGTLKFALQSFSNNETEFEIVSPYKALRVLSNNNSLTSGISQEKQGELYIIKVKHLSPDAKINYKIDFK